MTGIIFKEFAGKKRGFSFNMNTWEICEEILKLPIADILGGLQGSTHIKTMRVLFYAALKSHAEMLGEELELTEKSVGYHFNVGDSICNEVLACMLGSNDTIKPLPGSESKKKSGLKT